MNSEIKLDIRLQSILEETCQLYSLNSLLLADKNGLPVCHAGKIAHSGIAAIAPELIRVGDHAVKLGEYDSITCIALVLDNSHIMVIKDLEINEQPFVVVMDTISVPKGIRKLLTTLAERIGLAMAAS